MTVLLYVVGVFLFAVGVGVSIALHEIGHLVPAKRFGVRVTQYMVGFGPTVWSRRRGETEYGIKAIPFGGYVRMIGMFPPKPGDAPGMIRVSSTGRFSGLMDEARKTSLEEVRPGDEDRVFYKIKPWQKVVTMLGGPVMNLVIAGVLLTLVSSVHGVQTPQPGAVVAQVSECVMTSEQAAARTACTTEPKTPAHAAGIRPGDRIQSINGVPIRSTADVGKQVRPRIGQPSTIVVLRGADTLTLTATPIKNRLPAYDDRGNPILDTNGRPTTVETGFLGVSTSTPVALETLPVSAAPGVLWDHIARTGAALASFPQKILAVAESLVTDKARPADSPASIVGVGRVAGEISAGEYDDLIGSDPWEKVWMGITILASLNLFLFLFNLVPLLPLDGGHVVGALWEGVKKRWARIRGLADPGYVDVAKGLPLAYAVASVLLVVTALLVVADIVKPLSLRG